VFPAHTDQALASQLPLLPLGKRLQLLLHAGQSRQLDVCGVCGPLRAVLLLLGLLRSLLLLCFERINTSITSSS
jgi:hypothetical protein